MRVVQGAFNGVLPLSRPRSLRIGAVEGMIDSRLERLRACVFVFVDISKSFLSCITSSPDALIGIELRDVMPIFYWGYPEPGPLHLIPIRFPGRAPVVDLTNLAPGVPTPRAFSFRLHAFLSRFTY
jgi:hypothetical protein